MKGKGANKWTGCFSIVRLTGHYNITARRSDTISTVHNSSCGKVMFSQARVKNSVHRERCTPPRHTPLWTDTSRQTPPG